MYAEHFGLTETPFSIAPNPQYLYMSQRHKDALAHLLYGVQSDGGFILLTGEVGTGKTTLCRCLLEQVPTDVETAFVLNPRVTDIELLATICDEFSIQYEASPSLKSLVDRLNVYLLECHAAGKKAVLIIDEAQNLSRDLLEQLRLLTNLETNERKLLQIILLGQPELLDMLAQPSLRQFSQRVTARFHLEALTRLETSHYIDHRISIAGGSPGTFTRQAINRVYRISGGIPRLINLICDRSLLGAYVEDSHTVTPAIVRRAAAEVLGRRRSARSWQWPVAATVILSAVAGYAWFDWPSEQTAGLPAADPKLAPVALPPTLTGHNDITEAYHDLFALWGAAFEDRATAPCELANTIGLSCHRRAAGIDELSTLNRPVIVSTPQGYLTLSHLDQSTATLIAGDREYNIKRSELGALYSGEVELIWRAPPAYSAPLRVTDTGAAVDWLVFQLSLIDGLAPPLETGFTFNETIEARVRDFQTSVGLMPSGIVDELTWMHINNVEGVGIPTLDQKQG